MDFDVNTLIAGFAVSSVGFVLWRYGKRMSRPPQLVVGICLMAYPYFVSGAVLIGAIFALLMLALWGAIKLGH